MLTDYPTFSKDFDASSFNEESENPVIASDTEGGYVISRPRFTRTPRRTFSFKHVDLSEAERGILQDFWNGRRGGAGIFRWTHPVTGASINVRFSPEMKLNFNRTGYGMNHRWDTNEIVLVEV